jgi:hypothetical protein
MNLLVIKAEVDEYLRCHLHEKAAVFMLKKHPFQHISNLELTQQLVGLQKARYKFPILFENRQILYPPKVNLEQTSSEVTAMFKSKLFEIDSMIDVTGGFGIDVYAFAKVCAKTVHLESSVNLQPYAQQLFKTQSFLTQSSCTDGVEFLKETSDSYDLIYLDPSRKTETNSKAIQLKDYEPSVIDHLDLLLRKSKRVMIKTSPMLDITAGIKQLQKVSLLYVVAVKNEVKELLWILTDTEDDQIVVTCVNLQTEQPDFKTLWGKQLNASYSKPLRYLYEPNAAVMKSQQFDALIMQYYLKKLDQGAHLFTSNQFIDFPGRVFKTISVVENKPKNINRLFAKTARGIVTRNNKESVAQLRKRYKFTEHETDYLFFTSSQELGPIIIEAVKI